MENVILVDENDMETGVMEKMQAHQTGQLHRAFSVVLYNDKGEILLQRRAFTKYHTPGLWTNTCCSHPRPGENTKQAAERRLMEEMGIRCHIRHCFSFIYHAEVGHDLTEHEYDHVFVGKFSALPRVNPAEVCEWVYISREKIKENITLAPQRYTPWFKILFNKLDIYCIGGLMSAYTR